MIFCLSLAILTITHTVLGFQQSPGIPGNAKTVPSSAYVSPSIVPSSAREFLYALGDRVQQPGKERLILSGTYSDTKNTGKPGRLVWEAPGRLLFDRTGSGAAPLVVDDKTGVANANTLGSADLG